MPIDLHKLVANYLGKIRTSQYLKAISWGGILGDPGADSGGEGKSKRAEKYGTKKSKERRGEPLGTMSYQTSSKRSPPFSGTNQKSKLRRPFGTGLVRHCPGALLSVLYFSSCHIFPPV